jgi:hypothetical protein
VVVQHETTALKENSYEVTSNVWQWQRGEKSCDKVAPNARKLTIKNNRLKHEVVTKYLKIQFVPKQKA